MGTEKVSLRLEEVHLAEAREVAGTRGLSSYVNRALRQQLQQDRVALSSPSWTKRTDRSNRT
ncbi:MAG TPA: hypothetical protein VEL74_02395 [Thermoanaerobaculia bacterium]|nr:hypothetical protein [Thermoanaerobaculia bacterium]